MADFEIGDQDNEERDLDQDVKVLVDDSGSVPSHTFNPLDEKPHSGTDARATGQVGEGVPGLATLPTIHPDVNPPSETEPGQGVS